MAYDLRCDGVRLTLLVTARTKTDDPDEWCIEARGARTDALRAVARSWVDDVNTTDLRVFDWEAVAATLASVRAI
jgi:hypothetical protein